MWFELSAVATPTQRTLIQIQNTQNTPVVSEEITIKGGVRGEENPRDDLKLMPGNYKEDKLKYQMPVRNCTINSFPDVIPGSTLHQTLVPTHRVASSLAC